MPTPPILDFDALLAPLDGDNPAGADLRADDSPVSLYFKIKDARSAARAAERGQDASGENEGGLLPPWRVILELSPKVIAEQAKDLELAAWLSEALLRAHGVAGLRDGFRLAAGLVETFWDNLYPMPDEDGIETRVAPLTGLNGGESDGALIQPIRKVLLTEGRDPGPFALWQYEQATELLKLGDPEKVQARIDAGAATLDAIKTSARQTPAAFYGTMLEDITACLEEYARLNTLLEERCGRDAPPSSNIRNALDALGSAVRDVARDVPGALVSADVAASGPGAAAAASGNGALVPRGSGIAVPGGVIATREEAFRALLQVAEFFRATEPQSPVSYVIEEAVRRARLPLPELLAELIPDVEARRMYFVTAGIRPPESDA